MSGVRIGLSLREARERRQLTLDAVANELCIRADYLAALENERFDKLPGPAYARAWLRVYGEHLGLDSAPLIAAYVAEHEPAAEPEIFHRPLPVGHHLPVRPLFALGLATLLLAIGGVFFLGLTAQRTVTPAQGPPAKVHRRLHRAKVEPVAKKTPAPARAAEPVPVLLRAVGAWDPWGDHTEHDSEALAATDGNLATYWRTETYSVALGKPGVGLILDAGRPVQLRHLVVATDTPGFTAVIQAGASPTGPFHPMSQSAAVAARTAFGIRPGAARYWVVWITRLDQVAHLDEVSATR